MPTTTTSGKPSVIRAARPGSGNLPASKGTGNRFSIAQAGHPESVNGTARILYECLENLNRCFNHCVETGGKQVEPSHLKALTDCCELVSVTANFIARDCDYAEALKPICADALKVCSESCDSISGDKVLAACAVTCRQACGCLEGDDSDG